MAPSQVSNTAWILEGALAKMASIVNLSILLQSEMNHKRNEVNMLDWQKTKGF
jgi:hypothetical protein